MNSLFITAEQLKDAFGVKKNDALKQMLANNNVRFFVRRDGKPFTTTAAINDALGIQGQSQDDDGFNLDALQ